MATCETHGHLFGSNGRCVMCGDPAPQIPAFLRGAREPDSRDAEIARLNKDSIHEARLDGLLPALETAPIDVMERRAERAMRACDEIGRLQAFKDYVHARLDAAGVPTHPDGEHSKAGCRIGDRLDIVVAALEEGAIHATAWRTLGYVLGKFPELSGVIVDELRLLEVLGEKL